LNGRVQQWMVKLTLAGQWTRATVVVVVMGCVQAVYWGVWSFSADRLQPAPIQASQASEDDNINETFKLTSGMTSEQRVAWEIPRDWFDVNGKAVTKKMYRYWEVLEAFALTQGLTVHYEIDENSLDWSLEGDFGGVMAWLYELVDMHLGLVIQKLSLSPIDPGTWVKADVKLGVRDFGWQADDLGAETMTSFDSIAFKPFDPPYRAASPTLYGFDQGSSVSPFGLAPWFHELADEGWWNDEQTQRLTALQLLPLSQIQWVGSLMQGPRAIALLSAGGQVWRVGRGERVGQGLSRVVDIQPDHIFMEVLTLDGQGLLQRSEITLGLANH
jgi:Tfp pilus assembly protein PilP